MTQTSVLVGLTPHDGHRREYVSVREELLGVAKIGDELDPGLVSESASQAFSVVRAHPFVGNDVGKASPGL